MFGGIRGAEINFVEFSTAVRTWLASAADLEVALAAAADLLEISSNLRTSLSLPNSVLPPPARDRLDHEDELVWQLGRE